MGTKKTGTQKKKTKIKQIGNMGRKNKVCVLTPYRSALIFLYKEIQKMNRLKGPNKSGPP